MLTCMPGCCPAPTYLPAHASCHALANGILQHGSCAAVTTDHLTCTSVNHSPDVPGVRLWQSTLATPSLTQAALPPPSLRPMHQRPRTHWPLARSWHLASCTCHGRWAGRAYPTVRIVRHTTMPYITWCMLASVHHAPCMASRHPRVIIRIILVIKQSTYWQPVWVDPSHGTHVFLMGNNWVNLLFVGHHASQTKPYKTHGTLCLPQTDQATASASAFVTVTLQVATDSANPTFWAGVGFNDPSLTTVRMIGSDVVVAGEWCSTVVVCVP